MAIIVNLDVMMAKRKMPLNELSQKVDITLANLSILNLIVVSNYTIEDCMLRLFGCLLLLLL